MLAEIFGPDGLIVIVAVVLVLLFGGAKLPKLARSLGGASHEFKKGIAEGADGDGAEALDKVRGNDSHVTPNSVAENGHVSSTR